ncbi:hypothetical protein [Erythrobacter rubeus]|uniref:Uncharacterized protein n=1 Tax=Erythrobacter rubeus TaxID=2760803 RepID=A0ABR8KWT9_9SPHN|nr:hypothetical protein [Erythrobacter rubeus]MBD2843543.1 hypothetical protein [Erythrobacter rubeus]
MGTEFLAKTKRAFKKSWDKSAELANTPDLFRKEVETTSTCFEAETLEGVNPDIGDEFCVRIEDGKLIGRDGLTPTIRLSNPTPATRAAIESAGGVATAKVINLDAISGVVEVSIS